MKQTPDVRLQKIESAQKRWRSKLTRATNMLTKLHRQEDRLRKAIASPPKVKTITKSAVLPEPVVDSHDAIEAFAKQCVETAENLAIPGFLQRKKLDPVAASLVAEQEETKRLKARGRIAKMKAKQSGETKRMPLQGRAALEAIRAG